MSVDAARPTASTGDPVPPGTPGGVRARPSGSSRSPGDTPGRPASATRWVRARRTLLVVGVAAVALVTIVSARGERDDARRAAASDAVALDRATAARDRADRDEAEAVAAREEARADAAAAADARRAQRARLADLGLTEESVDAFVEEVEATTELVEWRRDGVSDEITLQSERIPQMDQCLVAARHAINIAFGTVIDPDTEVPAPTELCLTLMAPP